jgi:hypothetical protein
MRGHIGPRRALTGMLAVLALALLAGVPGASAARPSDAAAWRLPSSFSRCATDCSSARRIFGAQLRRAEATSLRRHGVATAVGPAARPDVMGGGFEGKVTDAKTKAGVTGIRVCAYELKPFEKGAYEEEELEPVCGKVTASSGKYQLRVPAGEYVVEFVDPLHNYVTQRYHGRSLAEKPEVVTVAAEGLTAKIDAALVEGGHIEGTVTAASDGAPLEGFLVCALDRGAGGFSCAETGSGGKYLVKGLPAGSYEVGFFVPPVPGDNYLDTVLSGIPVTLGVTTPGVNAALAAGGEIQGEVVAAEGHAPLAHVLVCAFLANGEEVEECVHTGANGTYTVERLPTGKYEEEFFDEPEYLTQFYAGAPHLVGATSIQVTAGSSPTSNINAEMISSADHSGSIEGKVTSAATSLPLGSVQVCARLPAEVVTCTLSAPDGSYKLEGLPEGSYGVEFEDQPDYVPQFYNGKAKLSEATPVPVTVGGTVKSVNAAMVPTGIHDESGSIEGRVTSAATSLPLAGVEVCALVPPEETVECAVSEADGDYKIEGLPAGTYKVEFEDEPDYASQFYAGKTTLAEATPVSVSTGASTTGINAALAPVEGPHLGAGSIEGRVTAQATGLALSGVQVCAIPGSPEKCDLTGLDGAYSIVNLPPGDYKVEFNDGPGFQIQFYDEASSIAGATTVHIAGEAKAIGINAELKAFVPAPRLPSGIQTESPAGSGTPAPSGSVLPTKTVVPSVTAGGRVRVSGRRASVKLDCAVGPCHGTVELTITVARRTRSHGRTVTRHVTLVVGSAGFSLAQGASGNQTVHLTAQGARLLATASRHPRAGKLKLVLQGAGVTLRTVVVS